MKALKIVYGILFAVIIFLGLLLIISVLPISGNYKILVVKSGSMAPAIKMGSVVVVKPPSASSGQGDYKIGDIITFGKISKTQTPTTHRILDIKVNAGEPLYITKGDANNAPDQKEISKNEIIGKVLLKVPYLGYVVAAVRTKLGFALIIIIPALLVIVEEVFKIKNEIKKKKTV